MAELAAFLAFSSSSDESDFDVSDVEREAAAVLANRGQKATAIESKAKKAESDKNRKTRLRKEDEEFSAQTRAPRTLAELRGVDWGKELVAVNYFDKEDVLP